MPYYTKYQKNKPDRRFSDDRESDRSYSGRSRRNDRDAHGPKNGRDGDSRKKFDARDEAPRSYGDQKRPTGRPQSGFKPAPSRPVDRRKPAAPPAPPVRRAPAAPAPAPRPEFDTPYTKEPENLLSGRNPIREALKADRDIEKMLVAKGDLSGSAREIVAMARERGIPVQVVDRSRLDEITPHHQGILAYASAYQYSDVDSILALARERGEQPFIIVLDGITDPHNLGAIIRSAACAGAHGVIVPLRRSVGLTPAAVKASAGAVETVHVARVTNLTQTLRKLKQAGLWIYAADMSGEDYRTVQLQKPLALIIGSEGEGISRLVLENADFRVKLPVLGAVDSLNASVAAGILMYHVAFGVRQ